MKNKRVRLDFMVVPEQLATLAVVPDAVRVKIIDPKAIFLTGILGDSGKKLVNAGIEFYFTRELAESLIEKKIAVEVKSDSELNRVIEALTKQSRISGRKMGLALKKVLARPSKA